ncbi:MFS transporter [Streptomyces atriruber]|uniref:MFS transporter n=1 Tax=Streptomyces atriruber TaxID=545121 RepID=A0ABV3BWB8_9ACTN
MSTTTSPALPVQEPAPTTPGPARRHGLRAAWIMMASGWSANQFSALLGAYRSELGLSESAVTGLFALYVVGLIPGLLVGGPLADRVGRRPVALTALALNLLSTGVLMLGAGATGWLWPGRFVTGVSAGALLAAASAWIKELSSTPYVPDAAAGGGTASTASTASRRAGLFVSAGFASGGLAAALIARWAPAPMVTAYIPHVLLAAGALLASLTAPETGTRRHEPSRDAKSDTDTNTNTNTDADADTGTDADTNTNTGQRFRRGILPVAPWVFAAPSVGFVTLPGLVHGGLVYTGVATALVPGTGLLVQPLARRVAKRHRLATAVAGLLVVTLGFGAAALAAGAGNAVLALVAAVILGAGYGFVLTYGLTEVAALAPPHRLARLTAYFWTAAYVGMFAPYVVTLLSGAVPPPALLGAAAVLAALSCVLLITLHARRPSTPRG